MRLRGWDDEGRQMGEGVAFSMGTQFLSVVMMKKYYLKWILMVIVYTIL